MARNRLKTILATTVLATGLAAVPASAQSLTGTIEDTTEAVEDTTEAVEDTTEAVEGTVEETSETLEEAAETVTGSTDDDSSDDDSTDDGSADDGSSNVVEETVETTSEAVEDTVDDVTRTVEDTVTKVTEEVAPDVTSNPEPEDDESTSGHRSDGSGGYLKGGGVMAAGSDDARTANDPEGASSESALGEAFAAFGALGRGGAGGGGTSIGGTFSSNDVPAPQVADPDGETFEAFPDAQSVEQPAVMASGPAESTDTSAALLKALAALMVLGTGIAATRAVEQA